VDTGEFLVELKRAEGVEGVWINVREQPYLLDRFVGAENHPLFLGGFKRLLDVAGELRIAARSMERHTVTPR